MQQQVTSGLNRLIKSSVPSSSSHEDKQIGTEPKAKTPIEQIQQLQKNIRLSIQKNRQQYNRILKHNPFFKHNLYNPPIVLNTKKSEIGLTRNLLIKQWDNLLQQENLFLKELGKIGIREEEEKFLKDSCLEKENNHYKFLRTVWKRDIIALDCDDRI